MLSHLRRISKYITLFLIVFLLVLNVTAVFAQDKAGFGLEETAAAGGLIADANRPPAFGPATVAGRIVGYLLAFVGVLFFGLMLYGGIIWMTARGNEEQIKKALDLIKSAVIGIAIVFLSYVITRFVLTRLTQVI